MSDEAYGYYARHFEVSAASAFAASKAGTEPIVFARGKIQCISGMKKKKKAKEHFWSYNFEKGLNLVT